jgi:hypothetical protein
MYYITEAPGEGFSNFKAGLNVDGFVFDCQDAEELCNSLKHRFPKKPLFGMVLRSRMNGKSPGTDYVILAGDLSALVRAVLSAFGSQGLRDRLRPLGDVVMNSKLIFEARP